MREITSSSFFLTKEKYLRKADKSELIRECKQKNTPSEFRESYLKCDRRVTLIDFMAFARKLYTWVNKFNLKTFCDAFRHLWKTFEEFGIHSSRIDIVFDLYTPGTTKASERKRRSGNEETRIEIKHYEQPLPKLCEIELYWSSDENKVEFQQLFISWMSEIYKDYKPVFLGGCHRYNEHEKCYKICGGIKTVIPELQSALDEADERIMLHINHAAKVDCFNAALICSRDSDVYVSAMYHFYLTWKGKGFSQIWMEDMGMFVPLHVICDELGEDLVQMLPAVHSLTGCDTTSKIGTKSKAFAVMKTCMFNELKTFGSIHDLDKSCHFTQF